MDSAQLLARDVCPSSRWAAADGIEPAEWTPRELRHSFVSLLSDSGIPIEDISRLLGHSSTTVTEQVYRHRFGQ
jgi:integrase